MIQKTILHYKIIKKLGEGGMGVVYLAEDTKLDRKVAIKFLPSHIADNSDERKRFEIEAKAAAALNHPNIATIYAIEESGDEIFLAMEFVEGEELKSVAAKHRDQPLAAEKIIRFGLQLAEGLQAAHNKNIIHRDIKSRNIMIDSAGKIKIMDFGLAKFRGSAQLTQVGTTLGTASYMSPEQARGEETDPRSDIWSLGVVLYELTTGRLPFPGDYDQAVIYAIMNEKPQDIRELRPDIPDALVRIINKCLEKNPADRYQNLAELIGDLNVKSDSSIRADSEKISSGKFNKKTISFLAVTALIVILAIIYFGYFPPSDERAAAKIRLVVLPFENLGPEDHAYFADGMTEEITSRLAMIDALGITSRKTAMKYKNSDKSLTEIADELGVDYVLEGTVRWAADIQGAERVRITPQLIQAKDDIHLWSDNYERIIEDVFRVQSDIARNVAEQLGIKLLDREKENISEAVTDNIEAYQAYLRGKYFLDRPHFTYQNWQEGINNFTKAVELDSGFALAWSELSRAHARLYFLRQDMTLDRLVSAKKAAEKALGLDAGLPGVHLNIGYYYLWALRDSEKALNEFLIAEQAQPNDIELLKAKSSMYENLGKWPELISTLKQAIELDPRDGSAISNLTFAYWFGHMYKIAMETCNKAIAAAPESPWPFIYKALIIWMTTGPDEISASAIENVPQNESFWWWMWYWQYVGQKRFDQAFDLLEKAEGTVLLNKLYVRPKSMLSAWIFDYLGEKDRARTAYDSSVTILEKLVKEHPDDPRYYSSLGIAYAGQGKREEAIRNGEKAVELLPVSKDAVYGVLYVVDLAVIYTMTADYDLALDLIEELLSIPSTISPAWLRMDIRFSPLSNHPRFLKFLDRYTEVAG